MHVLCGKRPEIQVGNFQDELDRRQSELRGHVEALVELMRKTHVPFDQQVLSAVNGREHRILWVDDYPDKVELQFCD